MSEEELKKASEPFFTTKLESGGTGLGLTISRSIIKEHNAKIKIESVEDEGTTITVTLPTQKPH
jgi:signal transduction histidine kinase